jgi:hypothetical protein
MRAEIRLKKSFAQNIKASLIKKEAFFVLIFILKINKGCFTSSKTPFNTNKINCLNFNAHLI